MFIMIMIMIMNIIIIIIIVTIKGIHYEKWSKRNEPHRFRLDLKDKLNLKNPKKIWL